MNAKPKKRPPSPAVERALAQIAAILQTLEAEARLEGREDALEELRQTFAKKMR